MRSGAAAQSTRLRRPRSGLEELPRVGGRGGGDERSYPASVVRGSVREEIPHAPKPKARAGGQEEQPHAGGQGRWPGGPTPRPRSCGYAGAEGPRGAIPR